MILIQLSNYWIQLRIETTSSAMLETPLHIAIRNKKIEMFVYLFSFIKTNQQKQEYLFMGNKNGTTILMEAFNLSNVSIAQKIFNKLGSNNYKDILIELVLEKDSKGLTCLEKQIWSKIDDCVNLVLDTIDNEEINQLVLLRSIEGERNIFIDKILSKLKVSQLQKLMDQYDTAGNNALSLLIKEGNAKYASIFLKSIDTQDDRVVANLINWKNYQGANLFHLTCGSRNLEIAKSILGICQYFQNFKSKLLLSRDHNGYSPLYYYLDKSRHDSNIAFKIQFISWYLSNI